MKPVPMECRDQITGVEYGFGCQQQLAWWLEPWTATLASMAIFVCIGNVLGIAITSRLRKAIIEWRNLSN